jgi:hypothetical protein
MSPKPVLRVIEGGKGKEMRSSLPTASDSFDIAAFLSEDETYNFVDDIPPEFHGKTIDGVQYGAPKEEYYILLPDDDFILKL